MDSTPFEKILVKHHSFEELELLLEIVWKTIFEGDGTKSFIHFFQSISIEAGESTKTFLARLKSSFQTSEFGPSSHHHHPSTSTTPLPILEGQQSSGTVDQEARRSNAHLEGEDWKSNDVAGNLQSKEVKDSKDQKVAGNDSKGELGGREGKSSTLASTLVSLESNSKPSSRNEENIEGSRALSHLSSDSRIDHESSPISVSRATGGAGETLMERSSKLEKAGKDGNDGRDGEDNQASRSETGEGLEVGNAAFEPQDLISAASPSATSTQVVTQPTTQPAENAEPQTPKDSKRSREPGSSGNKRPLKKLELSRSAPDPDEDHDTSFSGPSISSQGGTLTHHRQATGKGMDCEEGDANSSMVYDSYFDGASIPTHGHHLGSVDSTVAASSQPQEGQREAPASYSEGLSSNENASLNNIKSRATGPTLTNVGASSSSRPEGKRVSSTSTSTSNPSASSSSNGNASSTPTSRSIPHQGQQVVEGATDKASSKSTDSVKGTPFTTAQSDHDEKNLPSRLATNSGIDGRSKAAEDDGNDLPTLGSFSQGRALTTNQSEPTESLPTTITQPARAETDSPSLSPSNSTSGAGMTTSTTHSSFSRSISISGFGSGATLGSSSSLASMASRNSLIAGEKGKEGEVKAEAVEPSPTSSATEGGVEGKVGKVEGFEDGEKSHSKVEESEEAKRENVSSDTAESSIASSNLSEHAKKEISSGSASLDQGGTQIESSPTESSARMTGSNSFDPSSQASVQERQASNQPLTDVEHGPVTASTPPASPSYAAIEHQKNQALSTSPSTTSVSQEEEAALLSKLVKSIEGHVVDTLDWFRKKWPQVDLDHLVGMIRAEVDQLLSDAKKDSESIRLGNPTRLDKKDFTLVESQEEEDASWYEWDELKAVDQEVRDYLKVVVEEIRESVEGMDKHEALLEGVEVADVLYERTLYILDKYLLNLRILTSLQLRS